MSGHVAPHRWADAWAGKVADDERSAMEDHAASCKACSRAKARITRASDSFQTIRGQSSPELPWDSVRARVHWSVSTERRAKQPPPGRPLFGWITAGVVAAAGVVAMIAVPSPRDEVASQPVVAMDPIPALPGEPPVVALAGLVNRTTGEVMIDGIRPDAAPLFARRLGAGTVLATGDGRVDIQFGTSSAFSLGPHSTLELRHFDSAQIELVVQGTVDVQVAARVANQRFTVLAGNRTIEVRGTQFRVRHTGGATTVACRHGLVEVRDPAGHVAVGAARHVELAAKAPIADQPVTAMSVEELTELADATPLTMPIWDLATLASSAPLEIATTGRRDVRLDGLELGAAPMRVRVMPGRHTVEAADAAGRYRRAGWVDVTPGATTKPARLEVLPEPLPLRNIEDRRRQLRAGSDKPRLAQCMRKIVKQGLAAGAYVKVDLQVDAQGAINYLNVIDTDLDKNTASCIRDVLASTPFKPGILAHWIEKIDL